MEEVVKKIGKNAVWHILGRTINTILSIIVVFLLARLLGPTDYGIFSLAVTILFLFQEVTSGGLEVSLPYFMQKFKEKTSSLLRFYFNRRIIITIITAICIYLLADQIAIVYNNQSLAEYIRLIAVFFTFFVLMQGTFFVFQGFNDLKQSMKIDIVFSSTKFFSIILLLMGLGIAGAITGYGISYVITAIFAYWLIFKKTKKGKVFTEKNEFKKYALISFIGSIFYFLSKYLINLILGLHPIELGFFDSANKAGLFILLVPTAISTAILPSLTNKDKKSIQKISKKFMSYVFIYLTPLLAIFLSSPDFIINVLLGKDYSSIAPTFMIVAIATAIQGLNNIHESVTYSVGKPKNHMLMFLIRTIIVVLLSSFLINSFNAALVFLTYMIISFIFMNVKLRSYVKHPLKNYIKIIICAIPLIIILNMNMDLTLKIIFSIITVGVYLLSVYYKVMDNDDKKLLWALYNKILKTTKSI